MSPTPSGSKGLVIVYTGNGKAKTSAAMGTALRCLGHGKRVLLVQWMKGDWPVTFGELESLKKFDRCESYQMGKGFVKIMGDQKDIGEHRKAAKDALELAQSKMLTGQYDLVVLDEVLVALNAMGEKLIDLSDLIGLIQKKPRSVHLVLTGRGAPKEVIELADLVTDMQEVKHPYQKGIPACEGIDY